MNSSAVLFALLLTLFAGLCTGIGSAIAFFSKRTNTGFLSLALGFSAGVMIYVSFVDLLKISFDSLIASQGARPGSLYAVLSFFTGMAVAALVDRLVPSFENPHEPHRVEEMGASRQQDPKLLRMGIFSAIAITLHNFPEGLATFVGSLKDPTIGISIAIAVAIHNIPEGIAISVPVYYATGSRKKAFILSFLSGLAEPVGALAGWLLLLRYMTDATFGLVFAGVAGIMVFIALDELMPTAREYGEHHLATYGVVAGMAVMAGSLLLFIK